MRFNSELQVHLKYYDYFRFRYTTFHFGAQAFCVSVPKYGTCVFTSANPKHTLLADVILRRITFSKPILHASGPHKLMHSVCDE